MRRQRKAVGTVTVVLFAVIVILAGSLVFVATTPQVATRTVTSMTTQTTTATSTKTTISFQATETTTATVTKKITTTTTRMTTQTTVVNSSTTQTNTETVTQTITATTTQEAECSVLTVGGIVTPNPAKPWFIAGVNYSGPWQALVTVYDNGSPIFSACYTGDNTGGNGAQFGYQNSSLTSTATIRIIATKLDGSTAVLHMACNGNTNSTSLPYGSATLSAPVHNAVTG